jgi:ABC-type histidine transport system ATPase subunit
MAQPAESTETMISLRNLRVSYGEREILHGIDFDVMRGETLVKARSCARSWAWKGRVPGKSG